MERSPVCTALYPSWGAQGDPREVPGEKLKGPSGLLPSALWPQWGRCCAPVLHRQGAHGAELSQVQREDLQTPCPGGENVRDLLSSLEAGAAVGQGSGESSALEPCLVSELPSVLPTTPLSSPCIASPGKRKSRFFFFF